MMGIRNLAAAFLILVSVVGPGAMQAAPAEERVKASLLAEVSSIAPGQSFWVALRMKMAPHWHTYWINPGDSGLATTTEWTLPKGFTVGPIQWPYPQRIDVSGLISFAYEGEIYLLQEIHPPTDLQPGQNVKLAVQADWLVCEEICVPGAAKLELILPVRVGGGAADVAAGEFALARARLPGVYTKVSVQGAVREGRLVLSVNTPLPQGQVFFFPEQAGVVAPSAPQESKATAGGFELSVPLEKGDPGKDFRGVLVAEKGLGEPGLQAVAVELKSLAGASAVGEVPGKAPAWTWGQFILTTLSAFLAGMILNLMPCVFPVLSIKVLGFVKQSQKDPGEVKKQGLLFGAGVLLSFLVLAGIFLALKAAGQESGAGSEPGWAFQFQEPSFVIALIFLFFLMGLNLMGVFELGTSLVGLGAKSGGGARWESFLSGVLATVVATPCTGPFMGSAIGFALNLPAFLGLVVFASLGLGMAFPYVLLSFFPGLSSRLPKPGPWMETFKQSMAFPLFATVIWFFWVLGSQINFDSIIALLIGLLLAALGVWIYGRWDTPVREDRTRWIARVLAIVMLLSAGGMAFGHIEALPEGRQSASETETDAYGQVWHFYSPELIDKLRAEGKPIYVDFTARWCASCQVNKKLVFGSAEVRNRIKELGIVLVKGDWTRKDPVITKALRSFDRAGVPLNIIYPKGKDSRPVLLPELLTAGIVLGGLEKME